MAQLISVKLSRFDASPWGFRLQGGKDFGAPLLIQKVNGGSPSEKAGLQAGDAVIKVNDVELFNLRHKEAQDAIVRAGNNFEITVQRGGSTWKPNVTPIGPTPTINSSPATNIQPVTKTSLAARRQDSVPIGSGHNLLAKPFGGPQVNGSLSDPTVKSIVNKQYNTPVGIYSEQTIAETLSAQAEVLAGGVLGVNFKKNEKNYNAANSEVFKMVQEIDKEPRESEPESTVGAAPVVSPPVSGLRHVSAPETRPTPTTPHEDPFKILPPGQNICADCERLIVGVFVRIKDKNLHVECFKCATCGTSLKNVGYYNINNKLYCDVHAKLVARQHPPAPNLEPITIPPGSKAPAGALSAALSAATAPGLRTVPGPTSAPALRPAPVPAPIAAPLSPSSPQTLGPLPFHAPRSGTTHVNAPRSVQTPTGISAPKPFSVPSAPTTSPARPAPASNKFVWPPQREEDIASQLATATPLYIPPIPLQQSRGSADHEQSVQKQQIPEQPIQNQQIPEQTIQKQQIPEQPIQKQQIPEQSIQKQQIPEQPIQKQQIPEQPIQKQQIPVQPIQSQQIPVQLDKIQQIPVQTIQSQQLPAQPIQTQGQSQIISPFPQPYSDFISNQKVFQMKHISSQTHSPAQTTPVSLPVISSTSTQLQAQQESHVESLEEQTIVSQSEAQIKTEKKESERIKKSSVCSQEVSRIIETESIAASVEKISESIDTQVLVSSLTQFQERPPSPVPTQEIVPPSQEVSKKTVSQKTIVEEISSSKSTIQSEAKNPSQQAPGSQQPQATEPFLKEGNPSSNLAQLQPIEKPVKVQQTNVASSSVSSSAPQQWQSPLVSALTTAPERPFSPFPSASTTQTLSTQVDLQQSSESSQNPNNGLSYKQLPAQPSGGFRPISLEQQSSVCQEVAQYTTKESVSQKRISNQSVAIPAPVPLPKQTSPYRPKFEIASSQPLSRSDECPSPMVSALTIAPDRPYSPLPAATKPQTPVHVQSSALTCQATKKISHAVNLPNKPAIAPNITNQGDETQLPLLPPSSQQISMASALTIAPDRPYSPFPSVTQAPNTVVQSEASAFTAVSPQTITTRPKAAVPQSISSTPKTAVPQSVMTAPKKAPSQSVMPKPFPTSTILRTQPKPASPRPASQSSLPVMGAFRPTVPTLDLRPQSPSFTSDMSIQQLESASSQTTTSTINRTQTPTTTEMSTIDRSGAQVTAKRTTRVEESSTVTHKEMKKTIQKTGQVSFVSSSSSQQAMKQSTSVHQKQSTSSTLQQKQQYSGFGVEKPSAIPYYQRDIKRFQIQRALSPAPHSQQLQRTISPDPQSPSAPVQKPKPSACPAQQTPTSSVQQAPKPKFSAPAASSQSRAPSTPMGSQYQRQLLQQQQQQQQLYSLSGVQKPSVIPFYQQDIERYQTQRTMSPAPRSQQVQRSISPVPQRSSPAFTASLVPAGQQKPAASQAQSQRPSITSFPPTPAVQQQPIGSQAQSQPPPITSLPPALKGQQQPGASRAQSKQRPSSDYSLPFPNIPLPEGFSAHTLPKSVGTKPQGFAPPIQPSAPVAKPFPTEVPQPVASAFKTLSATLPLQTSSTGPQQPIPSLATVPSSVTKTPVPPTSSSIPNAGGGIGGGPAGGPGAQKGTASFAGSSAPRRGRGVLNQQAPGTRIPLCGYCNSQIRGPFITALGKIWCPDHFVCVNGQCRRPLQDIGFVEEKGDLYCEYCFEQFIAPTCNKCAKKIKGDCLNAIGKHFHPDCFLCAYCGNLFGNNPFFLEDGLPYCQADWNELFTTKCFACGFPIEAGDRWVEALSNNYHSQCFNCTNCKKNLEGQSFFAKGGRPFCKAHAR